VGQLYDGFVCSDNIKNNISLKDNKHNIIIIIIIIMKYISIYIYIYIYIID
jgi:hypothetical protein